MSKTKYTKYTIDDINNINNNKYVLLEYNKENHVDFYDFIFNLPNPKLFIFHILDSYEFLLNSLLKLEQINVCFFNLSVKNIIFTKKYKPQYRYKENDSLRKFRLGIERRFRQYTKYF
mgnify:CR=1 FL=1